MTEHEATQKPYALLLTNQEARDVREAIDGTLWRLRRLHGRDLGEAGFAKIARLEAIARDLPEDE